MKRTRKKEDRQHHTVLSSRLYGVRSFWMKLRTNVHIQKERETQEETRRGRDGYDGCELYTWNWADTYTYTYGNRSFFFLPDRFLCLYSDAGKAPRQGVEYLRRGDRSIVPELLCMYWSKTEDQHNLPRKNQKNHLRWSDEEEVE